MNFQQISKSWDKNSFNIIFMSEIVLILNSKN